LKDSDSSVIYEKIENDIEEYKNFGRDGFERIKLWYSLPEEKRKIETGLKEAPHEILLKKAVNLLLLGLKSKEVIDMEEPIDDILVGIGTEILLKSIILKEDPKFFIQNTTDEKTPSFQKCKEKLVKLLPEKFTSKQTKRVLDVLELIQQRRNNAVHFGFHNTKIYREDYQIANVLEFLLCYFFKNETEEVVKILREFKESRKVVSGIDYEPIDLWEGLEDGKH